ncbi:MAG TPA: SAM-dependent methyltransferase [Kofleriaceae bacterium]|nr:SAM-dependent methyltransferase [Kofleriaceae bacterium]
MADFAFATCLPGLEPAVKRDVGRARPELRFAFSRPGLVTFKAPGSIAPDDEPGTPFAWVWGRSLGPARDPDAAAHQLAYSGIDRVHAFARDPGDAVALTPWQVGPGGAAQPGELVADVIVATGEPAWLGVHRADAHHVAHPGGAIPVDVPAEAPSRAYAKLEEAIAWAGLPIARGDVAVEIGAAPGGALMALARRGVEAWGVDTGELAPEVAALPGVHHLKTKIGALRWEDLPERVDWLLVDVNLAPQIAVHEVARVMPRLRETLRGAVWTLKLNDWAFVDELPRLAARIGELGLPAVRLRHLPSNRREICAVAQRA